MQKGMTLLCVYFPMRCCELSVGFSVSVSQIHHSLTDPCAAVTTYSRRHNRDRGANVYCRQMRGFQIQHEGQRKRVEKWEVG